MAPGGVITGGDQRVGAVIQPGRHGDGRVDVSRRIGSHDANLDRGATVGRDQPNGDLRTRSESAAGDSNALPLGQYSVGLGLRDG